jgi:TonB family protein
MNPATDVRESTRISLLACVASMVFLAGATKSEAGSLQVSPNGDIRETIVRALNGLRIPKSFRMRRVLSGGGCNTTTVLEVMKPDRSHTIQNDNDETIFIGEKGYSRKENGPWVKFTDGMTTDTSTWQSDISEQIKRIGQVKLLGADTVDGVSVLGYEYHHIDASGKRTSDPSKIWIGLKDGLAYKTESETQCPAENCCGKPGDTSFITIKVVTTYYDFNTEIIIDLPEKAAREAAESWLKLVDSGRYSVSWTEAASVLKERYSEKSWEKRLNGFAEQASALIPIKSRELMSVESVKSLPSNHEREGVLLGYKSQLEKLGARSQTLELVFDTDQVWRVANYIEVVLPRMDGSTPGHGLNMGGGMGASNGTRGKGGGMGDGKGGGMGPGNESGTGPGRGSVVDAGVAQGSSPATSVDTRPIPLNSPTPRYSEQARNNNTQGTVTLRLLIGADGLVKQVRVVRGLPDGLNEQAIQVAYQLKFKPAMKDGVPVPYWQTVTIEFNLGRN